MSPTTTNFDENCGAVVRTLLTALRLDHTALPPVLGIQMHTVHRALNGERHWRMDELDALAHFFDVPVSVFFDTPEALLRNRCFSLNVDAPLGMSSAALMLA
jgi:BetR domain